jgi:hypothetical protein
MMSFIRASSLHIPLPANLNYLRQVSAACICGWIYHNSASPVGNGDRILSFSTGGGAPFTRFGVGILNTNKIYAIGRALDADPGATLSSTILTSLNTLQHIAVNIDFLNKLLYFYLNGAFDTSVAGDWTAGNTDNTNSIAAEIAARSDGTILFWDGRLDDIRLYNRLLMAEEIKTIYAAQGSDSIKFGCKARYLMNERNSGFTCLGGESVKNIYDSNGDGAAVAGCSYFDSSLRWRSRKI